MIALSTELYPKQLTNLIFIMVTVTNLLPLLPRDYLDNHPDVTFALVDYITSPSAVVLPVREIVRECRERGVRVMVDGAHAPGQLPLNIPELGAEFFTGTYI